MQIKTDNPWLPYFDLTGDWKLHHFLEGKYPVKSPFDLLTYMIPSIPARVPGNVELDLQQAGEIKDPFFGNNCLELREYEYHQYWYEKSFLTPTFDNPWLVFQGLDCIAEIWLNGRFVGSADNAMITHRFSIAGMMAPVGEENKLFVCLKSPMNAVRDKVVEPVSHGHEQIFLRKPAHCFGWDIMPRILSAGIWRPVYIEDVPKTEIDDLYFQTQSLRDNKAFCRILCHIRTAALVLKDFTLHVKGTCGEHTFEHSWPVNHFASPYSFDIENPQLWWPRGYGEQNLYDVAVELRQGDKVVASRNEKIGIRTIQLDYADAASTTDPGRFNFIVNGEKVFVKGSNWVPADAFHSRDAERIPRILDMFRDMNCSIVRCWGGNVYENHVFYDLCDQYGILVWQDFGMACSSYPQDDAFLEKIRVEAESVVKSLRLHPSLALWAGDNEIDTGYTDGWYGMRMKPSHNRLTREVLPRVVERLDPMTPYLPSSPYLSPEMEKQGNGIYSSPEQHLWGPRDYFKGKFYAQNTACFASEIGYHGCPAISSIKKFISPNKLWPCLNNDEWILHGTDPIPGETTFAYRVPLMVNQVRELFGEVPEDMQDFVFASQVSQAEAFKFFMENFRIRKGVTGGLIWWNMIDGWPQISDAIVDYYFTKKLAYHYLKRVHGDICVMMSEINNWKSTIVAVNDTFHGRRVTLTITKGLDKVQVFEKTFDLPANSRVEVGELPLSYSEQDVFILSWTAVDDAGTSEEGVNHYTAGTPPFRLEQYRQWFELIREAAPFDWDWK